MEMIEVDGLRIAYERAGAGPPLVLLHGYAGDARRRGGGSWKGSATNSRQWPGTHQGPVAHPIRRNRLAWPATPTAWPASSTGSGWNDRLWPGCRSADRKSTRLNSSHPSISYAVFCLKKKKQNRTKQKQYKKKKKL